MDERPRIERIDRIGSTAGVPYTRTLVDVKSQRWIADRFFGLMGRSCFFWDNVFHGEFDHLTNTEEVYKYFDRLASDIKELRIYDNEYHGVSRFVDEVATMSADFLRDRLNGVPPKEKRRIVFVDWNRMEHRVDEERLARGFSDFLAGTSDGA